MIFSNHILSMHSIKLYLNKLIDQMKIAKGAQ